MGLLIGASVLTLCEILDLLVYNLFLKFVDNTYRRKAISIQSHPAPVDNTAFKTWYMCVAVPFINTCKCQPSMFPMRWPMDGLVVYTKPFGACLLRHWFIKIPLQSFAFCLVFFRYMLGEWVNNVKRLVVVYYHQYRELGDAKVMACISNTAVRNQS